MRAPSASSRGDPAAAGRSATGPARPIAIFLPALFAGGAERVLVNLAGELHKRGHSVDLVLAHATGPYLDRVPAGVRVVDLGCRRVATALLPFARYLREVQPVAVHAAIDHTNVIALLARAFVRLTGGTDTRMVVSVHTPPSVFQSLSSGLVRARGAMVGAIARFAYRLADEVVAVSAGVADDVARTLHLPRERIRVIYNAALTEDPAGQGRAPLGPVPIALKGRRFLVAAGRLMPSKDFANLLEAMARLRRHRDVALLILGDGPERAALEALVQKLGLGADIWLAGFQANPYRFFSRAAVFVLPSRREGLPTVLIEAMACGCPIVSTDSPHGPREILADGRFGHLVPMGEPRALADAIARMLDHPTSPDLLEERLAAFATDAIIEAHLETLLGTTRERCPS
jgi:glycosyltransferase involved in cell wall biosynthesis